MDVILSEIAALIVPALRTPGYVASASSLTKTSSRGDAVRISLQDSRMGTGSVVGFHVNATVIPFAWRGWIHRQTDPQLISTLTMDDGQGIINDRLESTDGIFGTWEVDIRDDIRAIAAAVASELHAWRLPELDSLLSREHFIHRLRDTHERVDRLAPGRLTAELILRLDGPAGAELDECIERVRAKADPPDDSGMKELLDWGIEFRTKSVAQQFRR